MAKLIKELVLEQWAHLRDYPGYSVSTFGRVMNDRREKILAVARTRTGLVYTGLMLNGEQVKRSVSRLVAETFVPNERPDSFKTPIHLDGDPRNCYASNLLWRPHWFALKFTRQFKLDLPDTDPVREVKTRQIFRTLWTPVTTYGLLYMEIILAIQEHTWVFPTRQAFEWVI